MRRKSARTPRTRRRKKSESSSPERDSESEEEVMPTPRTRRTTRSGSEDRGVPSTPSGSRTRRSARRLESTAEETKPDKPAAEAEATADRDSNGSNDAEADSSTVWKVQNSNGSGSGIAKLKLCRSGPIDPAEPSPPRRGRGGKAANTDDSELGEDETQETAAEPTPPQASPTPEPDSSGLAAKPGKVVREEEESKEETSSSEKSRSSSPEKVDHESAQEEDNTITVQKTYAKRKDVKCVKVDSVKDEKAHKDGAKTESSTTGKEEEKAIKRKEEEKAIKRKEEEKAVKRKVEEKEVKGKEEEKVVKGKEEKEVKRKEEEKEEEVKGKEEKEEQVIGREEKEVKRKEEKEVKRKVEKEVKGKEEEKEVKGKEEKKEVKGKEEEKEVKGKEEKRAGKGKEEERSGKGTVEERAGKGKVEERVGKEKEVSVDVESKSDDIVDKVTSAQSSEDVETSISDPVSKGIVIAESKSDVGTVSKKSAEPEGKQSIEPFEIPKPVIKSDRCEEHDKASTEAEVTQAVSEPPGNPGSRQESKQKVGFGTADERNVQVALKTETIRKSDEPVQIVTPAEKVNIDQESKTQSPEKDVSPVSSKPTIKHLKVEILEKGTEKLEPMDASKLVVQGSKSAEIIEIPVKVSESKGEISSEKSVIESKSKTAKADQSENDPPEKLELPLKSAREIKKEMVSLNTEPETVRIIYPEKKIAHIKQEPSSQERPHDRKAADHEDEEQSDDEPLVDLAPGSPDEPDPEMAEAEEVEKALKSRKSRRHSPSSSSRSRSRSSSYDSGRGKHRAMSSGSEDSGDDRSTRKKRQRRQSGSSVKEQCAAEDREAQPAPEASAPPTRLRRKQLSPKPQRERIVLNRTFSGRRESAEEPERKEESLTAKVVAPEPVKIETEEDKENMTNHSPQEEEPTPSELPVVRKRRWGSSKSIMKKTVLCISSDPLKNLIPDAKPVPANEVHLSPEGEEGEVLEEEDRVKDRCKSKAEERPVVGPVLPPQLKPVGPAPAEAARIVVNTAEEFQGKVGLRKISIVNDVSKQGYSNSTAPKHRISSILYITNLVRPFTVGQLKELLSRTGKIVEGGFWINIIKSQCYVEYENEDQAIETRHALDGVRWPVSNRKELHVEFGKKEDMIKAAAQAEAELASGRKAPLPPDGTGRDIRDVDREERNVKVTPAVREWDLGKIQDPTVPEVKSRPEERRKRDEERRVRKEKRSPTPSHDGPAHKAKKKEEEVAAPAKLLDDLFRKTKTTPCIYWLPLTSEQIAEKEEMRRKHMAQHERLRAEMRKAQERNHGREREREKERERDKERDRDRERDRRERRRGSRDK